MKRYMLDTNMISHLIKAHPAVARRVVAEPMASLCISAITEGELLFGLAKRPDAKRLHGVVRELLRRVDVLPWSSAIAERYGTVRADLERRGRILAPLDLLIAAHALGVGAVLVTNDSAFGQVADLSVEDWTVVTA
ncbi:type II toxin-antitoxin system VapC family toxin [Telmatospirillum siberiense]|uniref:Ribonuclease VapC n=1 Tax=Telmatospirillum siberiense TaxID=382514 RepID=A0A2N3PMA9_9PROT|nr:type II toxin-antitoxin system VapC family toxin [Telmatospirillum siberiense]PKU21536.1 VapC toxin family PIN domain ribonuclease [Telmatospirillum siberiense]